MENPEEVVDNIFSILGVIIGAVSFVTLPLLILFVFLIIRRSNNKNFQQLAGELGLEVVSGGMFGYPSLKGRYLGASVRIFTQRELTHGDESEVYTFVTAQSEASLPKNLFIFAEKGAFAFLKRLGTQDIEVGDPAFDAAVIIKGKDPAEVREFLSDARRAAILDLIERGCVINDQKGVFSTIKGRSTHISVLKPWLDVVASAARALDDNGEESPSLHSSPTAGGEA